MNIALIQQIAESDVQKNQQKGVQAVRRAASQGAQVVCFAELGFEPFYPQKPAEGDVRNLAEPIPGPTTEQFRALARELGIVIILNMYERDGSNTYDSSPVINRDGQILGITRMVHITDYPCFHEKGYYTPGDRGAPVYATPFGKIGVAICYDRHIPEYMRALALAGAQVVFVPQAGAVGEWPDGLYEAELRVAAFQNGYFMALCNRVGPEECLTFAGESFICDPNGQVISRAAQGTEEILYARLDLQAIDRCAAKKYFLPDRRTDLYGPWLRKTYQKNEE
ncbi:MAG: carbon-nitrogen hydrolase family protein [Caldithrix sp.]|nr:carbon-nitrogen hydrolase family protein [Caldithrix sp.]